MSAKEFWEDDPQLFESYRISFINRKKRQFEEEDHRSWLQGLYIYDGMNRLFNRLFQLINNILSKQKDKTEIGTYPVEPYSLSKNKEEEKKTKNKYEEYHNNLMMQGSIKQIYLEKMKNQNKK